MKSTAWRFTRVALAALAGYALQTYGATPYGLVLTPIISAAGKFLRSKFPEQLDWLPF